MEKEDRYCRSDGHAMETNFVDLVKPVGEEDDHKQKQNKENNTEDGGGRRVSAKDVRNQLIVQFGLHRVNLNENVQEA